MPGGPTGGVSIQAWFGEACGSGLARSFARQIQGAGSAQGPWDCSLCSLKRGQFSRRWLLALLPSLRFPLARRCDSSPLSRQLPVVTTREFRRQSEEQQQHPRATHRRRRAQFSSSPPPNRASATGCRVVHAPSSSSSRRPPALALPRPLRTSLLFPHVSRRRQTSLARNPTPEYQFFPWIIIRSGECPLALFSPTTWARCRRHHGQIRSTRRSNRLRYIVRVLTALGLICSSARLCFVLLNLVRLSFVGTRSLGPSQSRRKSTRAPARRFFPNGTRQTHPPPRQSPTRFAAERLIFRQTLSSIS